MFKRKQAERNFLDSLYKQYSPNLNSKELELALKNFERKSTYEKKIIIAQLRGSLTAYEVDNGTMAYMNIFTLFISSLVLFLKDLIKQELISYIFIIILFIYVFQAFSALFKNSKTKRSKIKYLLGLLEGL